MDMIGYIDDNDAVLTFQLAAEKVCGVQMQCSGRGAVRNKFQHYNGHDFTGLAISHGSQLWFDLMNRLLNLRPPGLQSNAEEPWDKEKTK